MVVVVSLSTALQLQPTPRHPVEITYYLRWWLCVDVHLSPMFFCFVAASLNFVIVNLKIRDLILSLYLQLGEKNKITSVPMSFSWHTGNYIIRHHSL
jgi:hypothetical protein